MSRNTLRIAASGTPSDDGPSLHQDPRKTPTAMNKSSRTIRHFNALTPYRKAANEVIEHRRTAALTPGRDRRQSGRRQRESPRDIVNPLSRALALRSNAIESVQQSDLVPSSKIFPSSEKDDHDDMREPAPKFSIPLRGDDDDSIDSLVLSPPRSTELVEDDLTQRSVEQPRRAIGEHLTGNLRGSFGSIRTSDRFGDLNDLGLEALPIEPPDSSYIGQGGYLDFEEVADVSTTPRESSHFEGQSNSSNDATRISGALRRTSDIRPQEAPEDGGETTFILPLPTRDSPNMSGLEQNLEEYDYTHDGGSKSRDADMDESGPDADEDVDMHNPALIHSRKLGQGKRKGRKAKAMKFSQYGVGYQLLPMGVVKKLIMMVSKKDINGKSNLSRDTLEAIVQASDWFFEQASDDLGAYAEHAGRKTIDETDIITLMKSFHTRQRQTRAGTTPFALAQKYLPRELLQYIRMTGVKRSYLKGVGKGVDGDHD